MTISPLLRPRATLAAALLVSASFALQPSAASDKSMHGWIVTGSDSATAGLAPSPSFYRAADATVGESVRFTATIDPPLAGRYRFRVIADGLGVHFDARDVNANGDVQFEVWHDDGLLPGALPAAQEFDTEWIESDGSPFEMFVEWTVVDSGAVRGRVLWEREFDEQGGFPLEPISSRAIVAHAANAGLDARIAYEALIEKKGCLNCHASDDASAMQRPAPKLDQVRQRAGSAWIRDWIASPQTVRPGADMPQVVFGSAEEVDEQATALTRFLESLSDAPEPSSAATEPEVLQRGRDLYHAVGCVACHGALISIADLLDDEYSSRDLPQGPAIAPFGALEGKWRPAALSAFLQDPLTTHPDGRMPSMHLSAEEADSIANYLADHFGPARDLEGDATDVQIAFGRKLFVSLRCNSCHTLDSLDLPRTPAKTTMRTKAVEHGGEVQTGCVGSEPRSALGAPLYDFDRETQKLLMQMRFLPSHEPADAGLPSRDIALAMERHACRACHVVDGFGGPADDAKIYFWTAEEETDLGDEGRFPPDLSGVGHKLTTHWMREVLMNGGTARPYMATRMPQFGAQHMDGLAELFAAQEGLHPDTDLAPPEMNDEMVMTGRELMGLDKMACVTCHVYKDFPPLSTDGPDMTAFAERLRYEWWRGYVHDPQRYKPGTRMPSFGTGNVSSFKDVLDGDLAQQADALWAYMNLGDFMPVPEGLETESEMIIPVGDRPVVMRAFLPEVGARGIAVGFPNGMHFGYDAKNARLVHAWTGEFLDAAGSWAGRGGSENSELGEHVWVAPAGPALLFEIPPDGWPDAQPESAVVEFRGYHIDDDGVPVFESTLNGVRIEERIETQLTPQRSIVRHFRVSGLAGQTHVFPGSLTAPIDVKGGSVGIFAESIDIEIQASKSVKDPVLRKGINVDPASETVEFTVVERI